MQLLSLFRGGEHDPAAAQRRRRKRAAKRALAARLRSDEPPARLTEAILEYWWSLADDDKDGVLVAREAVSFLNLSGLPREALARVWNAAKAANGVRGQLSRAEFAAALRLTGMAQQSLALLDSGLTIKRAAVGKLALKPRLEGVDDVPTAEVCDEAAPDSAPKPLAMAPLTLWASPLEALQGSDESQPPLPLARPAAAKPAAPQAVPSSGPGSDVVSPAQRVLAAAAAEREAADAAAAALAAARRARDQEAAEASSSDDEAAAASASRRRISVKIKDATPDASAPPPKAVALAPPPGARGSGVKPAPLTFKPGGSAEEATAQMRKPPPPPPPRAPPRAVAVLHEEQRMLWASEKLLAMGVRGSVLVLPRDGGSRGDIKLTLRGAPLACATLAPTAALHVSAAVVRRALSSAPWAPLRARDADVAERWRRARDAAADAAFLAATAPTRLDVRCAAAEDAPAAACGYALGARASPPALRCALRRRPLVIPFGAGAAIAVAFAGGPRPLADVVVTVHLGAPFASAPDAAIDILKASGPGPGEWREATRSFTWRVGDVAASAPPQLLQLHIGARRDGEDAAVGTDWQPLHAELTARVVPSDEGGGGTTVHECCATALSGLEAELRQPAGCGMRLSASVRAAVYATEADAAEALHAATLLRAPPAPAPAEAPAEAAHAAADAEELQHASPPASPAYTTHSSATADSEGNSSSEDDDDDGSPPATPRSASPRAPPSAEKPLPATALFAFAGDGDGELPVAAGDALEILSPEFEGWIMARRAHDGARGVVPSSVVALEPGDCSANKGEQGAAE